MLKRESFVIASKHDGLELSVMTVAPEGRVRGLVQFSHGMAEHKERYLPVMEFLAEQGYACVINDHRGHGASVKTPDDLGFFYRDGGRGLVKDLHQITLWFRAKYPGKALALVGHSMGSLAARDYAAKYSRDIDGLILSGSPGFNAGAPAALVLTRALAVVHGGQHARSRMMDALLNGPFSKRFKGGSRFAWLSANPENVRAYEADPLCGFGFTINGYRALLNLMLAAYNEKTSVRRNLPVFFMSGEDDPCAPDRKGFESAMENLRQRGCAEVNGRMYPGLRPEIFNEGVQEVFDDLLAQVERMTARR